MCPEKTEDAHDPSCGVYTRVVMDPSLHAHERSRPYSCGAKERALTELLQVCVNSFSHCVDDSFQRMREPSYEPVAMRLPKRG